jgi:predicted ribosome quality control (RQC) complex YloA/Tae2 family protein
LDYCNLNGSRSDRELILSGKSLKKQSLSTGITETAAERVRRNIVEYELPGGWKVFAGKNDADNDFLSLKMAKPNDFWFHVRGMPGSHVVLRAKPNEEPDRNTLKYAAAVAAFHSKARKGGVVSVSYTNARYVTKPKGAKPGSVRIRKESVFKVRPGLPEG